jgi:hypothetical protein
MKIYLHQQRGTATHQVRNVFVLGREHQNERLEQKVLLKEKERSGMNTKLIAWEESNLGILLSVGNAAVFAVWFVDICKLASPGMWRVTWNLPDPQALLFYSNQQP